MLNAEKYKERIEELEYKFALCGDELKRCRSIRCDNCDFNKFDGKPCNLRKIEWLMEEYKEPLLTEEEKIIIKDIIKAFEPFGKKLSYICKEQWYCHGKCCYLNFKYGNDNFGTLAFDGNDLFKGMKEDKAYTLEELGL